MALTNKTMKYLDKNIAEDISNRLIIVTGANSGVGYKATEELLYLNAKILMACRNEEKAMAAKAELLKEFPNADIMIYPLDLASQESIKKFAIRVKRNKLDIYGLVNNAGCYHIGGEKTKDGYELVLGTNYLGTYALVERLLPYLKTLPHDVRIINTTSLTYKKGKMDYSDFFAEKKYNHMKVYSRSKLCIAKYSIYLANKLMYSNVRVIMTHPGMTPTPLAVNSVNKGVIRTFHPMLRLMQTPEKSALAIPYVLGNDIRPGTLYGPHGFLDGWGYPKNIPLHKKVYVDSTKLIQLTEKLLSEKKVEDAEEIEEE